MNEQPSPTLSDAEQDYVAAREDVAARLQLSADFAQAALKGLTIVNGGAIVALFTFIGNKGAKFDIELLWWAFGALVAGLTFVLIAYFGAFYSQLFYMRAAFDDSFAAQGRMHGYTLKTNRDRENSWGTVGEYIGVGAAVLSLIFFAVGAGLALSGVVKA